MGVRHTTRRLALQALYGLDANPEPTAEQAVNAVVSEFEHPEILDIERLSAMVDGAWGRVGEIDERIGAASRNWKLSRMDRVDRAILRLGVYELMLVDDVPAPVALSEAVELAKEFGAPESPSFINGILDKVARELRGDEVKPRDR